MNYQFQNGVDKEGGWMKDLPPITQDINEKHLHNFFRLMYERQEIWYKRFVLKEPRPWTDDPYLRDYKFTNVYRELDRASQWLIKNVLLDHTLSIEDLLFKIFVFRFYNQPNTFTHPVYFVELPNYKGFDPQKIWRETVTYRQKVDNPWHTAYMMNMAFVKKPENWAGEGLFKDEAYCKHAFTLIHKHIPEVIEALQICSTPEGIINVLEKMPAVAGFQSYEFFIDFCYVAKYWKQPIMDFTENSYTNVGPGASLGLRLIFPSLRPENQKSGIETLKDISEDMLSQFNECFKYIKWDNEYQTYVPGQPNITLHQCEMFLCEYAKYWKMTIKQGKQRSKFIPISEGL
jgi:hypothetical protein